MNACDCPDCGTDDIAHNECLSGYCESCCPDCWDEHLPAPWDTTK